MTLSEGIVENPRVYVVAKDSDYHDIATGKIDGITAVVTGKLTIEGDVNFMRELQQMMKPLGRKAAPKGGTEGATNGSSHGR
jgi:putative sterol carrier protein